MSVLNDWHGVALTPDIRARLDRVVGALHATRDRSDAPSVRVLLTGAPGVGKTEVRRALGEASGLAVVKVGQRDLGNGFVGGAAFAVKALFERAREAGPSVLLMDQFEEFARRRNDLPEHWPVAERVAAMLMEIYDDNRRGAQVSIVAETYKLELVDVAVLERGFEVIEIPPPNEACRVEILRRALREMPLSPDFELDETAEALGLLLDGRSGRDLVYLVRETVSNACQAASRRGGDPADVRITREMLFDHKMVRGVLVAEPVTFDSLDLPEEALRRLRPLAHVIRHYPEVLRQGILPPRALLISGHAKLAADAARAVAVESGLPLQEISGENLLAREREQPGRLRQTLDSARSSAPCAVLVTGFEHVAARRGTPFSEAATGSLVSDILVHTDDRRPEFVLLMATTADVESVDQAVVSHIVWRLVLPDSPARGPVAGV